MNREKLKSDLETRVLTCDFEVRSIDNEDGTKSKKITGYALKFNTPSNVMWGDTIEIIDKRALDSCDLTDVACLINHNWGQILGRVGANNLVLEVDSIGLRFECDPVDTTYTRDLLANMEVGNINKCSFGFKINWDNSEATKWKYDSDTKLYTRTILDFKQITDVSIVTRPAYEDTEAAVSERSLQDKISCRSDINLEKRRMLIELELD